MKAINATTKKEIACNVIEADSLFKRMKGLLGRKKLDEREALRIRPCKSIHTIGMRFPIDVVFLNKRNVVIALKKNIPPNRITGLYLSAVSVLELPAETLSATGTKVGDRLEIA